MGGFLLSIILISELTRIRAGAIIVCELEKQELAKIEIFVTGAVERPGLYRIMPGIMLREVLKEAKLSEQADRKKVCLKKVLYSSQRVVIPSKQPAK